MAPINEIKLAWLAGILEGEGCFKMDPRPRIAVAMTDEDIIERVATLFSSSYTKWNVKTKGGKSVWQTTIGRRKDLPELLTRLYPYMGKRRQEKIDELFIYYKEVPSHS